MWAITLLKSGGMQTYGIKLSQDNEVGIDHCSFYAAHVHGGVLLKLFLHRQTSQKQTQNMWGKKVS